MFIQVFDILKQSDNSDLLLNKIKPVNGDISEEKLGLSNVDHQMLCHNINIVVHCAATLDFETDLKTAVSINLMGTKRIVELCKNIKNLQVKKVIFYLNINFLSYNLLYVSHFLILVFIARV